MINKKKSFNMEKFERIKGHRIFTKGNHHMLTIPSDKEGEKLVAIQHSVTVEWLWVRTDFII